MGLVEHQGLEAHGDIRVPRQGNGAGRGWAGTRPHRDPHRRAGLAGVAAGAVDVVAAAAEAHAHQLAVHHRIHQPAGSGHLGTGLAFRQVTAWIGRRQVKLETEDGEFIERTHLFSRKDRLAVDHFSLGHFSVDQ